MTEATPFEGDLDDATDVVRLLESSDADTWRDAEGRDGFDHLVAEFGHDLASHIWQTGTELFDAAHAGDDTPAPALEDLPLASTTDDVSDVLTRLGSYWRMSHDDEAGTVDETGMRRILATTAYLLEAHPDAGVATCLHTAFEREVGS